MASARAAAVLVMVSSVCAVWQNPRAGVGAGPRAVGGPASCMMLHCRREAVECFGDSACRAAMFCNARCGTGPGSDACDLECQLSYGYNSTMYRKAMQCMADHKCLPVSPPDGICLANDTQTISNLTSIAQIPGKWWILRGLNCGQPGWPAGFDYFPCQRDEFVLENGEWIDHIAYCGGSNNTCTTPMLYTVANVTITSPGVMTHYYTDPPLTPQTEEWRVLSWPHPDWMLYVYCGSTPAGVYAGASVVSRAARRASEIPPYVEQEFIRVAHRFGFNYSTMCISDDSIDACID